MKKLRILVACEYSGRVREAFKALGHDAMSCDLLPTEQPHGNHYEGDIIHVLDGWMPVDFTSDCDPEGDGWCQTRDCDIDTCDCIGPTQDGYEYKYIEKTGEMFGRPENHPHWDLMIGHPPCTYMANSGALRLYVDSKKENGIDATRWKNMEQGAEFFKMLWSANIKHIAIENPIMVGHAKKIIGVNQSQVIQPWWFGEDASKATCLWLKNLPKLKETNRLPGDNTTRRANQTASGQNKLAPSPDRWKERSRTYQGIADALADQYSSHILNS